MNESQALEAIRAALLKTLNKDSVTIDAATNLIADGVMDSLDSMVFLMELTAKTGKDVPDENATDPEFFKVERLVAFLAS
jgi:acyl carrier protein